MRALVVMGLLLPMAAQAQGQQAPSSAVRPSRAARSISRLAWAEASSP